ncbi:nuclear transport factor 2 family protein [archaeon]|jgi:ketosteroid isomerase-like protein|nr:nuclear transport factor 2 family protein [Chloroflexota bacterium]MBT3577281.1 nuclear transport factor 2 family protein [archaeon]MBT6820094.1 nuclear transport factor 2 family protein [archaeon]MBT6956656.1 nuclear transport factor 2 family protein [archaeon]MBT7239359.1 nuclear transport factor 2 family protein [archaeon]
MNTKQIKDVMKKYGKAWENQDTELILDCFTKNGVYQESPLAKPYRGHKEIAKFWDEIVVGNTKDIKFKTGKCWVSADEKTGFAEWECNNKGKWKCDGKWSENRMVGIMILTMKEDKITYLNEYWNTERD